MKPGSGSRKGGKFERWLARELSMWWFGSEGFLWRRPGSGYIKSIGPGRATGDIIPVADRPSPCQWPIHVQAKHWRPSALKFGRLLFMPSEDHPISRIWDKEYKEKRTDLFLMLILKTNRMPVMCVVEQCYLTGFPLDKWAGLETIYGSILTIAPWADVKDRLRKVWFGKREDTFLSKKG